MYLFNPFCKSWMQAIETLGLKEVAPKVRYKHAGKADREELMLTKRKSFAVALISALIMTLVTMQWHSCMPTKS
jgi:hypothetical protein